MSDRVCVVESCDRGGKLTRNMCGRHYRYWLDHTPPHDRPVPPRLARNFWDFVAKRHERGCWTWNGPRDPHGYGRWSKTLAHRHSWSLANGPVPEGMWVLHHCDNRPCVNPLHLYVGTVAENVRDAMDRGRIYHPPRTTHCPRGHPKEGDNLRVVPGPNGLIVHQCRICDNRRSADGQRRRRAARKSVLSGVEP